MDAYTRVARKHSALRHSIGGTAHKLVNNAAQPVTLIPPPAAV